MRSSLPVPVGPRLRLPTNRGPLTPTAQPFDVLDLSWVPRTGNPDFNRHTSVITNPAYRAINDIVAMVTVEEDHDDELVITEHPVEYGAAITDHSYKRPSELRVRVGWSAAAGVSRIGDYQVLDVKTMYEKLLALQNSRNPFSVYTGKKFYTNMLVAGIRVHTDARFEYSFLADVSLKQILLVSTQTITGAANSANQANPASTGATQQNAEKAVTEVVRTEEQLQQDGAYVDTSGGF